MDVARDTLRPHRDADQNNSSLLGLAGQPGVAFRVDMYVAGGGRT